MARKRNNAKGNFAILTNMVLQDVKLSYKARGVFSFMWSKPETWRFTEESLADASNKDGRDSVRSALKELIEYGYLYRYQEKTSLDGKFTSNTVYELYEDPLDNPYYEKIPDVGLPDVGLSDIGKSNSNIITDTYKTQKRDILLLQDEIFTIFDEYCLLQSEENQYLLNKERDLLVRRILFNVDSRVENIKRYVTTSIENALRSLYAVEEFNKYKSDNHIDQEREFTNEEKEIAKFDWDAALNN